MVPSETDPDGPRADDSSPQDVSNQNNEEPSAPHQGAQEDPSRQDDADTSHPADSNRSSSSTEGTEGGAGESTQATGNPNNAG